MQPKIKKKIERKKEKKGLPEVANRSRREGRITGPVLWALSYHSSQQSPHALYDTGARYATDLLSGSCDAPHGQSTLGSRFLLVGWIIEAI